MASMEASHWPRLALLAASAPQLPFIAVRVGEVPVARATAAPREPERDRWAAWPVLRAVVSPRSLPMTAESVAVRSRLPVTDRRTVLWIGIGRLGDGVTGRGSGGGAGPFTKLSVLPDGAFLEM